MRFEFTEEDMDAIDALKVHAQMFLNSGLWANSAPYPSNFAGKDADRYREWSKRAFALIQKLPAE